jgi:hypothetical protein
MRFPAYSGWTVYEDILGKRLSQKIGLYCGSFLPEYGLEQGLRGYFSKDAPDDERCDMCRWLMKSIVFTLRVMFDEWATSARDIHPCAKSAVHHHPEAEDIIWAAAELAVSSPVGELGITDTVVDSNQAYLKTGV